MLDFADRFVKILKRRRKIIFNQADFQGVPVRIAAGRVFRSSAIRSIPPLSLRNGSATAKPLLQPLTQDFCRYYFFLPARIIPAIRAVNGAVEARPKLPAIVFMISDAT